MNSGERGNRKVILAIVVTVVILAALFGGYILYKSHSNKLLNDALVTGYGVGYNKSLQDVAQGQSQTGSILTWNAQNNSIQIISIQDICAGIA